MGKSAHKKRNIYLAILLVTQLGVLALVLRPARHESVDLGPLLKGFEVEQLTGLTITDGAEQGIGLEKRQGEWVIVPAAGEAAALPADGDKLQALLTKLAALTRERLVTRTASSHNRLKVGSLFERQLVLTQGTASTTLLLGSAPNYKTIHVRLADEDEVYIGRDLSPWEAPVEKESWWRTAYLNFAPADLQGVELANAKGTIKLGKDAAGQWLLDGLAPDRELAPEALQLFLEDVSRLSVLGYEAADYTPADAKPVARLRLTTAKAEITLEVGPKDADKGEHVVKASNSPFYATASGFEVKELLERASEDLVQVKGQTLGAGGVEQPE